MQPICMGLKLALWPLFQKELEAHVESVKKVTNSVTATGFGAMLGRAGPRNEVVIQVSAIGIG